MKIRDFIIVGIASFALAVSVFADGELPPIEQTPTKKVTQYWKWEKPEDVWTVNMYFVHDVAERARELGYSNDSPFLKSLSEEWWREKNNLDILAKTVYYEAGLNSFNDSETQQKVMNYVAAVVLNRVKDPRFPNTVKEVVSEPGQYNPAYASNFNDIPLEAYFAAVTAMDGNSGLPEDVVYQANFLQGTELVEWFPTKWGTAMYFCK